MDRPSALLITDADNTLYDFASYYEAGIRSAVSVIERQLNLSTAEVVSSLRDVFSMHGNIEYPFAMEELPGAKHLTESERRDFVWGAIEAFWTSAVDSLTLYPGVADTLRELMRQNVPVVAYTDAPIHELTRRLRHLKVDKYITGIVAQEWFSRRPVKTFAIYLHELPGWVRPPRRMKIMWRLRDAERKPNLTVYQRIVRAFGIESSMTTVVGDSVPRDLVPALEAGMTALWARYGRRDISKETVLQSVVPNRLPEIVGEPTAMVQSILPIDNFSEVLSYLPVQQLLRYNLHR